MKYMYAFAHVHISTPASRGMVWSPKGTQVNYLRGLVSSVLRASLA